MKVLVTGRAIPHQPDRSTGEQLRDGFNQAGHDAIFFGSVHGDWQSLHNPEKMIGIKECRKVEEWDLVVVSETNDEMPGYEPLLSFLQEKQPDLPIIYQDYDISYNERSGFQRAGAFDYSCYLVANKYYLSQFEERFNKPVLHSPYAFSPQFHKPHTDEIDKPYLMGFIGSMTPERKDLIERLGKMMDPAMFIAKEGVYGDDLVDLTSQLGIMFHKNQDACKGMVPGRPFESIGCRTTLLMDRVSYDDFREFFPKDLHDELLVYDTESQISQIVQTWKEHKARLWLMGDALRSYGLKHHTYKVRAEQIIDFCEEQGLL